MTRKVLFLFSFLLLLSTVKAQTFKATANGIKSTINSVDIEISFYSPSILRIVKSPKDHHFTKESLSVIKQPQKTIFSIKQQSDLLNLVSGKMRVTLNIKSGVISYSNSAGNLLLKEKEGGCSFTPFNDAGNNTFTVFQAFTLDPDEAIYGLGQQQAGKMVQRNLTLNMVQNNTSDYIPFFQSVKGYGLFWDNYSPTQFVDNQQSTSFKSDVGECIDYYFMYGGNADEVIANMRDLTGQVPMFPLWTYGFFQSKERYKSQDELLDVVKKYRELKIPLDGIIQDWQYWGNNDLWNAMEFLDVEFSNPKKWVADIHNLNAHLTISVWNSFGPETKQYKELEKINALFNFDTWPQNRSEKWRPNREYLFTVLAIYLIFIPIFYKTNKGVKTFIDRKGVLISRLYQITSFLIVLGILWLWKHDRNPGPSGVRVYDAYNPAAREIYWKYLKGLLSYDIDGWWMDSSEPDHLDFKPSDLDNKTYLGSFRKVRNAFPLMTVGGVFQHQRAVDSNKRIFILTRSAFAGQQRYGANTWSGDVTSSWAALRNQISAGLNFSLTGIPYWNADIGGFFLTGFRRKLKDPEYRELYARWLEFGTFTPMMRSHGADAPREIYQFGKKGDKVYDAVERYINIRYRLLPYIYSTSWDVTANQSSMMRALMMDFPHDKNALDINTEYMFGRSLLVSPVTSAMYVKPIVSGRDTLQVEDFSTVKLKETYLPAGADWFDFWTAEKLSGGMKVIKQTPLDIIPVYVKAGSILPIGPNVQYAAEKKWDDLEIRIYPGGNGKFVLYEDENDNYNYEKGICATISFDWNEKTKTLTISDRKGSFPGMLNSRKFNIVVVSFNKGGGENIVAQPDKEINYGGKKMTVKF